MRTIDIRAIFITKSGRTLAELTKDAGLAETKDTVNEAIVALKAVRDCIREENKVVAIHPETMEASVVKDLTLDSSLPMKDFINMTFPTGHRHYLTRLFNQDCESMLTEAFYVYDRLVTQAVKGLEIAVVDDPENICRIHYLDIGHMSP